MNLDDEELIRLAFEATRAKRHGEAIDYLKQAVEKSPKNFMALYLLGAEHAQLGLADRAIEEWNRALELAPDLHPARFQLGLLLVVNDRVPEALAAWEPFSRLDEKDAFHHVGRGMEKLCRDDLTGCRESLQQALKLDTANRSLNADIQRMLDEVSARLDGKAPATPARDLGAYTKALN